VVVATKKNNERLTPCDLCSLRGRKGLREFTPDELAFIKTFKTDELHLSAGTTFLQQGAASEHLYTLLRGWAIRYKTLDDGRRQILNYVLPADLVGLQLFARAEEAGLVRDHAIQFPFTQQHLADTLGMSLVRTNKTLKRLFATEAVRWSNRVFEVFDRELLVRIAGENVALHQPRPFI